MPPGVWVIDTNVIVSGLIGADSNSPPVRILDAMLEGDIPYLMSDALLHEYYPYYAVHVLPGGTSARTMR